LGNLDFSNQPMFSWYCLLLLVTGIAMLCMIGVPGVTKGARIANLLFGAAYTGYAVYLIFMFKGGHYFVFLKALLLPVLLIVVAIKSATANRAAKNMAQQPQPPMVNYGQPQPPMAGYGQPQQYQQSQPQPGYAQPYQQPQPPVADYGQPQQYQQPYQPAQPQPQPQPGYAQQYQQPQPPQQPQSPGYPS